jgi:hypothetical protein
VETGSFRTFALGSSALHIVSLVGKLDGPQPQLLFHLRYVCTLRESAAPPCQFAK